MGLVESWRTRNNHTFIRKLYGTFFDYPCACGNLAKILGNINQLCSSEYYRYKTYSSENVRGCKLYALLDLNSSDISKAQNIPASHADILLARHAINIPDPIKSHR